MLPPHSVYSVSDLRSDSVPDTTLLQQSVAAHEIFIDDIDERLVKMEREMEELRSLRQAASTELEIHRGLLSPIRRLLPEILEKVFEYAVEESSRIAPMEAPHVLTHVCHKWRTIALAARHLWRQVRIDEVFFKTNHAQHWLSQWLSHSGTLPVNITIKIDEETLDVVEKTDFFGELCSEAVQTILRNPNRQVERFTWFGDCLVFNPMLMKIPTAGCPALHSLTISMSRIFPLEDRDWAHIGRFLEFPQLRSLELWGCGFLFPCFRLSSKLQRLTVKGNVIPHLVSPYATWISMWKTCPNLVDVEIDLECVALRGHLEPMDLLEFNHLRRLKIHRRLSSEDRGFFFMGNLLAPKLRTLEIHRASRGYMVEEALYEALYKLISCASSALRYLSLPGLDTTAGKVKDLLRLAPEVRKIRIASSAFITALHPSPNATPDEWICPKLTSIGFQGELGSMADIVELIIRRATASPGDPPGSHYLTTIEGRGRFIHLLIRMPQLRELNLREENATGGLTYLKSYHVTLHEVC